MIDITDTIENDLKNALENFLSSEIHTIVLSDPRNPAEHYKKIKICYFIKGWQVEKLSEHQSFHKSVNYIDAEAMVGSLLGSVYLRCNLWDSEFEYSICVNKKGKVRIHNHRAITGPKQQESHNRRKHYLLPEGTPIPPLLDMGIFSKVGEVRPTMQNKYRQINRFVELIDDEVKKLPQQKLNIIDFGCGKSYLTFILYYYFSQIAKREVQIVGLDLKAEVIARCNEAAKKYGYEGLSFAVGDIAEYTCDFPVDIVISLHACDTATDYALYNAIRWNAKLIFCVPCCQHELNKQMQSNELSLFTQYGIVQERSAALLTDAIRANLVESCGYQTQLLEFVDFTHTPKNLLLRAVKTTKPPEKREAMRAQVAAVTKQFDFHPTLQKLLENL